MKKLSVLVLAGCVLLFSCSKSNNDDPVDPDPNPGSEAAQKLQKDIVGKYSFPAIALEKRGRESRPHTTASGQRTWSGTREPKPTEDPPTSNPYSFIEFTADSIFIVMDENGKLYTGKYLARSGDSVSLQGIGGVGSIKLSETKLEGRLVYSNGTQWANLSVTKSPAVQGNNPTAAISHSWHLLNEDAGAEEYTEADSVNITFSAYGTYLVEYFNKGAVIESALHNWQWHSTKANTFTYKWFDDVAFNEDEDQVQVREVTADVLKLSEFYDDNSDGVDEEHQFRLVRARIK